MEALADEVFVTEVVAGVLGIRDEAGRDPLAVLVEHLRVAAVVVGAGQL